MELNVELEHKLHPSSGTWPEWRVHLAFRIRGRLMHKCQDHLAGDAMLAATAKHHGLIIVTRNAKDFEQFGVQILNPFITT